MTEAFVVKTAREALVMVLVLAMPALGASLVIGLAISILQATTQIQEQTLTFVPKIVGVYLLVLVLAGWLLKVAVTYTTNLYSNLPGLAP